MLLYSCMNVQMKEFFCAHNIGISRRVSISKLKIEMEEKENGIFQSAVGTLQTLVVALGAGLGIWGVINLMEGYGNDNPGANAHVR